MGRLGRLGAALGRFQNRKRPHRLEDLRQNRRRGIVVQINHADSVPRNAKVDNRCVVREFSTVDFERVRSDKYRYI